MAPLSDDIDSAEAWIKALEGDSIPIEVIERLILRSNITVDELKKSKAKRSALVDRLREAMGITPKKESPLITKTRQKKPKS